MGRFSFSNELNDFVKGFGAGAEVVDNAQIRKLRQQELKAKAKYYDDKANKPDAMSPFLQQGQERFAPGGPGSGGVDGGDHGRGSVSPMSWSGDPGDTAGYLKHREGFLTDAQKDVNAPRLGYGSDTMTDAQGNVHRVNYGDKVDQAGADRDLNRRIAETQKQIAGVIGEDKWSAYSPGAKTALTSVVYNYGPGWADKLPSLLHAAQSGNPEMLARAIEARAADNNRVNEERRLQEAWLVRGGSQAAGSWRPAPVERSALPAPGRVDAGTVMKPSAANGGMIRRYEGGGPVAGAVPMDEDSDPNDADDQKPYYADDLMQDVGNAMGRLGEVVRGGLQGLQEKFGLSEAPAIAQADPAYGQKVEALARADGAPPPEQVNAVRAKVDPENRLGTALGTTYGMVKAYDYYLAKGDTKAAQQVAANIILFTKSQSQQLGSLAVQALQEGDTTSAVKALQHAYNMMPNGNQMSVQDGKATVTDPSGKVVRQFELTPEVMMNAAMGFTKGNEFLDDLVGFASGQAGRLPKQPGGLSEEEMDKRWSPTGGSPASAPVEAVPTAPKERVQEASAEQTNDASPEEKPLMAVPDRPQMLPMIDTRGMSGDQLRQTKEENTRRQHTNDIAVREYDRVTSEANKVNAEGRLEGRRQRAANDAETRKRRHEEMKAVDDMEDVRVAGTDAVVPPKQLEATREVTKHLIESNELLSTEGLRYAQQIVSPNTKLTLGETKDGGAVTMPDGETLNLTPRAFRAVKRIRDNFDAKKAEADKPSALGVLYNALTGK